jgi:thiamine-monophosphate kinase
MVKSRSQVKNIGEKGLIKIISEIIGGLGSEPLTGEDDAVAIPFDKFNSSILVINTDMLVSTTDVPPQMTLFEAGRKAVVMCVSDVLVKGAIPKWGVVSLGFPNSLVLDGDSGFKGLIKGIKNGFDHYKIKYLGGDLNESMEIIVSCTVFGENEYGKVIPRNGAKVGDIIISTGEFGKTGCGFALLLDKKKASSISDKIKENFIRSVLNPETSQGYADILLQHGWVHASADSSDGIYRTLIQICESSGVTAELDWTNIPIAEGVSEFAEETGIEIENLIFQAGEEFLHIYIIPSEKFREAKEFFNEKGKEFYKIGRVIKGDPKILLRNKYHKNSTIELEMEGFEHFKKKK